MPRYFLDITDGGLLHDSLGENLTDDADAGKVAVRIAREIEHALELGGCGRWRFGGTCPCFESRSRPKSSHRRTMPFCGGPRIEIFPDGPFRDSVSPSPSQPTSDVRSQPDIRQGLVTISLAVTTGIAMVAWLTGLAWIVWRIAWWATS